MPVAAPSEAGPTLVAESADGLARIYNSSLHHYHVIISESATPDTWEEVLLVLDARGYTIDGLAYDNVPLGRRYAAIQIDFDDWVKNMSEEEFNRRLDYDNWERP